MNATRRTQVMTALGNPNSTETRSDFNDLPSTMPRRFVHQRDMTRIVEGADDLKINRPAGVVRTSRPELPPLAPVRENTCLECNRYPCMCRGMELQDRRTPKQIDYMENLISWIGEHDADAAAQARTYTDGMTERGLWVAGRGANVSIWIDRLKAKLTAVRTAPKAPAVEALPVVDGALPVKVDKNGKPMPLYYAVELEGTLKFYRIKPGRKDGFYFIDAQASDELHAIRNNATKATIISAIIAAGPEACMARYGQEIGRCGRCYATLTDADSRARGIGPDCAGKM